MASLTAFTGTVPDNYDKYLGPVFFEPYAIDVAERLKGDGLHRVLEIACGTGRVTRHLLDILPSDGQLTATDLNPDMLEVAKEKITGDRVHWQVADAQALPFDAATFDHAICQFGVMFFPDKLKAFQEVYRVLQPGGLFLFSTWGHLKQNPASLIVHQAASEVFGSDGANFMQKGPFSFHNPQEIEALLQEAGFASIAIEGVSKTSYYANTEYLLYGLVDGTPMSAYIQQQPAALQEELRRQVKTRIIEQYGDHHIEVPMQALVCQAVKSA